MSGTTTDRLIPLAGRRGVSSSTRGVGRSAYAPRWQHAVALGGVAAATLAVWLTLRAGFLAYPGWLAAQKADFILGPIGVGLYWHYKRPQNRLGLMLIGLGLLGAVYILESSTDPTLFRIGVFVEDLIYVWTTVVLLAFPSGRLEGLPERLVIGLNVLTALLVLILFWPPSAPGFTISGCRVDCPGSAGATSFSQSWLIRDHVVAALPVVVALATAGVIVWRFATGTPPRRRALAIGAPVALLFLLSEAAYRGIFVFEPRGLPSSTHRIQDVLQWSLAGTRSLVWYGFLFALIAAELYAGRVLRMLVRDTLRRPSFGDLEGMLRGPLGDPGLRLGFGRTADGNWTDAQGSVLRPATGQQLTEFEREGGPAVAIVHDAQLSDNPELLETAGEIALLALENAELEAAQQDSLRELAASRGRLVQSSDRERRRLERDLHDGAQQRLTAIQIKLRLAAEDVEDDRLAEQIEAIGRDAAEAVEELRALSHGIYPTVLRSAGPVMALRALAMRTTIPIVIADTGIGRSPPSVEAAVYFCCAEAIQNAVKHGGDGVTAAVSFSRDEDGLTFTIADDGVGMSKPIPVDGDGLVGMRDRIGAVGGQLVVDSVPGKGTTVRGRIPAAPVGAT